MPEKKLDSYMWVERYRPARFEDVLSLPKQIPELIKKQDCPNFLFVGSQGTGKTAVSKVIINELDCDCLQINGSEERGIDVIREKVKTFAMTKSSKEGKFKVILIDEMDYLTGDAQATLRNLMETYSKNCRYIFTANFGSKIIAPLQSRCAKFTFEAVKEDELLALLKKICDKESVSYDEKTLKKIIGVSRGDIRKSINILQQNSINGKLMDNAVMESNIKDILRMVREKKEMDVRRELIEHGTDYEHLISEMYHYIVDDKTIPLETRKKIVVEIADCLYQMSFVLIKEIPFARFLIRLGGILNG